MIFQLNSESVNRSSTLTAADIGKWCFLIDGAICGFCDTWVEAKEMWHDINN
jgi:hypothetical protein